MANSYRPLVKVALSMMLLSLLMLSLIGCIPQFNARTSINSSVTKQQKPDGKLTYVAIGASDTFGFGTNDPYHENWAADLASKLGPSYHLINLGIPGVQLHDALTRELPVALDARPDVVTIWLAVNDIIDNVPVATYSQDLDKLLSRLQSTVPHARIAVANVPDLTLLPYFYNNKNAAFDLKTLRVQIFAYNTTIASIVALHHAVLIDLSQHRYDLQHHPEYVSADGLHPTALGYARLAALFYEGMRQ
jgi:lysophospholipase L1-like esterase